MKTLYQILIIYFLLHSTISKSQNNSNQDIYEVINSLDLKNKDDTISKRPYLSISPRPTLGPWLKTKAYYKPFDTILSKNDIDVMMEQATAFDTSTIWQQDKIHNMTIVDWKKTVVKKCYHLEYPVFSKDRKYAIVKVQYNCGNLCGGGCWILYQKMDHGWKKIMTGNCGIS